MTTSKVTSGLAQRCGKFMAGAAFASVVALSAMPVTSAHAEDGKSYSPSLCRPYGAHNDNSLAAGLSYSTDAVRNYGTSTAYVVCPTVKDDVFSSFGLSTANIRYHKSQATSFIYCNLFAYSTHSTSSYIQGKSDNTQSGYQTFWYSPMSGFGGGTYSFICGLPPGGALMSYRADEYQE